MSSGRQDTSLEAVLLRKWVCVELALISLELDAFLCLTGLGKTIEVVALIAARPRTEANGGAKTDPSRSRKV